MNSTIIDIKIRDDDNENEIEGTENIFTEESYQFIEIDSEKLLSQLFVEEQNIENNVEYNLFASELIVNVRSEDVEREESNFSLIIVSMVLIIVFCIVYKLLKIKNVEANNEAT